MSCPNTPLHSNCHGWAHTSSVRLSSFWSESPNFAMHPFYRHPNVPTYKATKDPMIKGLVRLAKVCPKLTIPMTITVFIFQSEAQNTALQAQVYCHTTNLNDWSNSSKINNNTTEDKLVPLTIYANSFLMYVCGIPNDSQFTEHQIKIHSHLHLKQHVLLKEGSTCLHQIYGQWQGGRGVEGIG